ncbi:Uncharacterised protein [Fusobacterium polymorphum]|nr:Uncharacterised protein [Fusobacterium polymorphum]
MLIEMELVILVVGRSITGNENPEERYRLIKNMFEMGDKYVG